MPRRAPPLALLCLAAFAAAADPLPPAPGATVVTVTPAGESGTEPAIAVNPRDPRQVVAAAPRFAAYSEDGGRSFTAVRLAADDAPSFGDVSLTFDDRGRAYLGFLSIERNGLPGYWGHGPGANGIYVRRSADGGRHWDEAPVAIKAWRGDETGIALEDMPRLWADTGARSPHRGNLYAAWIEWQLTQSVILYSRSVDGGASWSTPQRISTRAGLPRDDNGAVVGPIGTVAPDGTQYVVWNEGLNITLAVSRDGGRSFAPSHPVVDVAAPYFGGAGSIPGLSRAMGFPQVGVDPHGRAVYVCWSDFRHGDVDVFVARSGDGGRHFGAPVRVNDDSLHDGADQFLQWMAVDPTDGAIYVQFYDRREDPTGHRTRVSLARSTDGGRTFRNYAWSPEAFSGDTAFLGDYEWLTAYGGRVYGVWTENAPPGYAATPRAAGGARTPTVVRVGTADFRAPR
ncbi:MAG: exo-alpha-sialidase [Proteobacteria bacterium]|nr:exo-alpha-sialidase [Pseudomonadota bacterium]